MLKSLISKGLTVPHRGENRYNIPYQGGQGGSNLKSILNLIITSYLSTIYTHHNVNTFIVCIMCRIYIFKAVLA